ncbi:hypothetical protein CMO92_04745 [Candidatus Woesearchaeota archaeon]|nr:hypothetical protein [Candidatus Woesearchaeota archaeon]|tara:strand:- start:53 stop:583 length:531 start_codon:yes stop_codon:yes gene_type:complete
MNIEVEIRSFISKEEYDRLLVFFREEGELVKDDYQVTYYFDCEEDLRIQRNNFYSKIWFKKGKIHDEHREEIEIKFDRDEFEKLERLFLSLGYGIEIKWLRKRFKFSWEGIVVCVDDTKGYGRIIELEQVCSDEEKEDVLKGLKEKLARLGVSLTPKEVFERRFLAYKKNWRELIE